MAAPEVEDSPLDEGTTQSRVKFMNNPNNYMVQALPDEYMDAMLDNEYMEQLVLNTERLVNKRRKAISRYGQMNQVLLTALIIQALLTTALAVYKTFMVPTYNFSLAVALEDVDMVLMIDAAGHIRPNYEEQLEAAKSFSDSMFYAMDNLRYQTRVGASEQVRQSRAEKRNFLTWESSDIKVHNDREPDKPFDKGVGINGGRLRLATGFFNTDETDVLHTLTLKHETQGEKLKDIDGKRYQAHSQWADAMQQCSKLVEDTRAQEAILFKDFPSRAQRCFKPPKPLGKECSDAHDIKELCTAMPFCEFSLDLTSKEEERWICVEKKPLCRKQFCIIIGDSDAMCRARGRKGDEQDKAWSSGLDEMCKKNPMLCPPEEEREKLGNPVEWSSDTGECAQQALDMLYEETEKTTLEELNAHNDIKMVMMFTVPTEEERQIRLRSPVFREFVTRATGCVIKDRDGEFENPLTKKTTVYKEYYLDEDTCLRFILTTGLEELERQAQRMQDLLQSEYSAGTTPNPDKDRRYAFFFLGILNLLFYLGSTKIVQWYTKTKLEVQKAMGQKKKMIKVTKSLVEKVPEPGQEPRYAMSFAELELAQIEQLKQPIPFGAKLELRARLKGGFLRGDMNGGVHGDGHQFDQNANWFFDPINTDGGGGVSAGNIFRIRNNEGEMLCVDAAGTPYFASDDEQGQGDAAEFTAEAVGDDISKLSLGGMMRIKCVSTGQYLRVNKDGACDGFGNEVDPETQFQIDIGGAALSSKAIVTLMCDAAGDFVHASPLGGIHIGEQEETENQYREADWRPWMIEKKRGAAAAQEDSEGEEDAPGDDSGVLKEGDIVTIRALNHEALSVDQDGNVSCAKRKGDSATSSSMPEGEASGEIMQEFVIHRVGVTQVTKHNDTIRRGGQISLKPLRHGDPEKSKGMYLRYDVLKGEEGELVADGAATSKEITFTVDEVPLRQVVTPLNPLLSKGDASVKFTPLWNKNEIKQVEALSAAWTDEESLNHIKGPVIVADDEGTYTRPKGASEWVAVVPDGVDLFQASEQAMAQGATGLIVRCDEAASLDRLALGLDGEDAPCLPIVFVNTEDAEGLNERGIVLKGGEFRRKYMTNLMRALGSAKKANTVLNINKSTARVFDAAGEAMLEWQKDLAQMKEAERERAEQEAMAAAARAAAEEASKKGNFKWKVDANTNYYWGRGAGGANMMKVNYGKAVPPSAGKAEKTSEKKRADASGERKSVTSTGLVKRTRISVSHVDPLQVKNLRLHDELSQVLTLEQAAEQDLEMLADSSDFKIEYKFEEVEVAIDAKPEDLDERLAEQEYLQNEGMVVQAVGVPKSKFWIVATAMIVSTMLITFILLRVMTTKATDDTHTGPDPYAEGLDLTSAFVEVDDPLLAGTAQLASNAASFMSRKVADVAGRYTGAGWTTS